MISPVKKILPNGLPVILFPSSRFLSVEIALYVKAGPMWESHDQTGISHLLEHLVLKGSKTYSSSLLFHQELERLGIMVDALTKEEHIFFSFECHPNEIKQCIELLFDSIAYPRFDSGDIANEKRVIEEEYHTFMDENKIGNEVFNLMFPRNRHSFNLIGNLNTIKRMSPRAIRAFHRLHFNAGNMVLCISGEFSSRSIFPLVQSVWGQLPSGKSHKLKAVQPAGKRQYRFIRKAGSPQIEFNISFASYPWTSARYASLRILSRIFGESACSRLFSRIREKNALAYDIGSSLYSLSVCGIFDIRGICSPCNLMKVLVIVEDELRDLCCKGPSKGEFATAQKTLANSILFSQNSLASINDFLGLWRLLGKKGELAQIGREADRIKQVKPVLLKALSRKIFSNKNMRFVAYGPINKKMEKKLSKVIHDFLV